MMKLHILNRVVRKYATPSIRIENRFLQGEARIAQNKVMLMIGYPQRAKKIRLQIHGNLWRS